MRAMIFTVGVVVGTLFGLWWSGGYIRENCTAGKIIGDDRGGQYTCAPRP